MANSNKYDSLSFYYQKAKTNPEYLHKVYLFAFGVHRLSPDTTLKYSELGIEMCIQNNDSVELAYFYKSIGIAFSVKGDYQNALNYTTKAYELCALPNIKPNFKPSVLTSMGIIYEYLDRFNDAVESHTQAVEEYKKIDNQKGVATSLNNLGIAYVTIKKDYKQALSYFFESLEIREKIGDIPKTASSLNNIGETYMNMEDLPNAIEYINRATKLYIELKDSYGLAVNYMNIANIYKKQNKYKQAMEYSNKSIAYADSLNLKLFLQKNYKLLSDIYKDQGNYKNAYKYYVLSTDYKDSIINENNLKKIRELDTKYKINKAKNDVLIAQQEKQLQEIEIQKQKGFRYAILVIIILALIILLLVFNRASQTIISKDKKS